MGGIIIIVERGKKPMLKFNLNVKTETVNYDSTYDFIALGLGPAGLNAGLYAMRKGLNTLVVGDDLGGQLKNTSDVDNYLGFKNIDASQLINEFQSHIKALEVPLLREVRVISINKADDIFTLSLNNGKSLKTKTLLYALGGNPRKLEVPREDLLAGHGISYCVTCDGPFYKGQDVVVAGGGNSALDAALDLVRIAKSVTIIQRSVLRADERSINKLKEYPNVKIMLQTQILEFVGGDKLEAVKVLDKKTGKEALIPTAAVFVEIGNTPNTTLVANLVKLNDSGEIIVDRSQKTSLTGLYAAGDVTANSHRQIIIAAAEGAIAALEAASYLNSL